MKKIFFIIACLFGFNAYAQNTFHEFSPGIGQSKIKNSFSIPAGMSGASYLIDYKFITPLKNRDFSFGLFTAADYARQTYPNPKDYFMFFHNANIKLGTFWLRRIPLNANNLNLFSGIGISFSGSLIFTTQKIYSVRTDAESGYWYLSPDIIVAGNYTVGKFRFQSDMSLPIVCAGYFSRSYFPAGSTSAAVKRVLTPNSVYFLTKRFYPHALLGVSYPFCITSKTEWRIQLKYAFESLVHTGFPSERKEMNALMLGMVWVLR